MSTDVLYPSDTQPVAPLGRMPSTSVATRESQLESLTISELELILSAPELGPDGPCGGIFRLEQVRSGLGYCGERFYRLRLSDVTGSVELYSRCADWSVTPGNGQPRAIGIRWVHDRYENLAPLVVPAASDETLPRSPLELLPADKLPKPENLTRLFTLVDNLTTPGYIQVIQEVFVDPDFAYQFATLPASKWCHHTSRGGLLEHSLDVAEGVQRATEGISMSPLQREATILTALLHDIGKVLLNSREGHRIPGDARDHAILLDFALAEPMAHLKEQDLDAFSALWQVIDGYKRKDRYAAPFAALIESLDSVSAQNDLIRARSAIHGGYRLPGCNRKTVWQPLNR